MHFDPPIVQVSICSLSDPLLYRFPAGVFLDRGHPCFKNFNPTIPVDVIRVKPDVDNFLDPACIPVRISITKLYLVPDRMVARLLGVFQSQPTLIM